MYIPSNIWKSISHRWPSSGKHKCASYSVRHRCYHTVPPKNSSKGASYTYPWYNSCHRCLHTGPAIHADMSACHKCPYSTLCRGTNAVLAKNNPQRASYIYPSYSVCRRCPCTEPATHANMKAKQRCLHTVPDMPPARHLPTSDMWIHSSHSPMLNSLETWKSEFVFLRASTGQIVIAQLIDGHLLIIHHCLSNEVSSVLFNVKKSLLVCYF